MQLLLLLNVQYAATETNADPLRMALSLELTNQPLGGKLIIIGPPSTLDMTVIHLDLNQHIFWVKNCLFSL